MTLIPATKYPLQTVAPSGSYPFGSAQNITVPSDGTGTPWEKASINDVWGLFQSLVLNAGVTPNGNSDAVGNSQLLQAFRKSLGAVFGSVALMRAADSSEFLAGTMVAVADATAANASDFFFGIVTAGVVTDDNVRQFVFNDDAAKYVKRISAGHRRIWEGTFAPLSSVDDARFMKPDGTYQTTAPGVADYIFPAGARLASVEFSNTGAEDISGLAFYADPSPSSPAAIDTLAFQITPKVDILAGETRIIPVTDGAPDLANVMAVAFSAREIDASTTVVIKFVFELFDSAGESVSEANRRGDALAPVEAAGAVDLANRIADHNYQRPAFERFDITKRGQHVVKELIIGGETNKQHYTEDPQNATWYGLTSSSASIDTADTIEIMVDGDPVKLTRVLDTSAVTLLFSDYASIGEGVFAGLPYIMSFYVVKATEGNARFFMRSVPTPAIHPGHGQKMVGDRPRRVWSVAVGNSGSAGVREADDPTLTYAATAAGNLNWFEANLAALTGDLSDVYIGGFQFEFLGTAVIPEDGIIIVGDEVSAGIDAYPAFSAAIRTAGNPDQIESVQFSRWIETELSCRVFNRAIEGDTLGDIATRWATDVTAIASVGEHAKYVIIQGGANDMVTAFDAGDSAATVLAALKVSVAALHTLALADGLIPVYLTVSPHPGLYGDRNTVRRQYNSWLDSEYALVIDINKVLESSDQQSIVREQNYSPDGFNLDTASKEAVGKFIARQRFWDLPRPSPYQKATTTAVDNAQVPINMNGGYFYVGVGTPQGVIDPPGGRGFYMDKVGGSGTTLYVNTDGTITGWAAFA